MKKDRCYTITITDNDGKYINSVKFWILPENSSGVCRRIINWSFDHLKNNFIYNLACGKLDKKVRPELLSKEKQELIDSLPDCMKYNSQGKYKI